MGERGVSIVSHHAHPQEVRQRRARILYFYGNISGMATDISLFRHALLRQGWEVDIGYFDDNPSSYEIVDLQISLEQIYGNFLPRARINAFMVNQEIGHDTAKYALVDCILCKTYYAARIIHRRCKQLRIHPLPHIIVTRFSSTDVVATIHHRDPLQHGAWNAPGSSFLHVAGKSRCKQTRAVLDAWSRHPEWPTLHVVCNPKYIGKDIRPYLVSAIHEGQGNRATHTPHGSGDRRSSSSISINNIVMHTERLSEEALRSLQMNTPFHICPSEAEGWGHAINEARSCAAVIITTNGPPMNELAVDNVSGVLVRVTRAVRYRQRHLWMSLLPGSVYLVDPTTVTEAVQRCIAMSMEDRKRMGMAARYAYEYDRHTFELQMKRAIHWWQVLLHRNDSADVLGAPTLPQPHTNLLRSCNYIRANVNQIVDLVPRSLLRAIVSVVVIIGLFAAIRKIVTSRVPPPPIPPSVKPSPPPTHAAS